MSWKLPQKLDDFLGSLGKWIAIIVIIVALWQLFGKSFLEYQEYKYEFFINQTK